MRVVCREFVMPNLSRIYFCIQEIFKRTLKPFFLEYKILNLCSRAMDSQRLLRRQKAGENVRIKAFWYTKITLNVIFTAVVFTTYY